MKSKSKYKIFNKKAQGHIEVVVSFSIFIVFMLFLLVMFNPLKKPVNPEVVEGVFINLEDNLGSELEKASIEYIGADGFGCLEPGDIGGLDLCDEGMVVDDSKSDSNLYDIYCAETGKLNLNSPCLNSMIKDTDYQVNYVTSKRAWSMKALRDFRNSYCDDYKALKDTYVLPTNDFAVVIYESGGDVLEDNGVKYDMERNDACASPPPIPTTLNVFSRMYPIETFSEGAEINQRIMQVIVW